MKIIVAENYADMSKKAAEIIERQVRKNSKSILGLATGSTPEGTYKELIRLNKEEELDFKDIKSFNLDEYVGIDENNPNSYRYFMDNTLFNHINIDKNNTFVPNGKLNNIEEACKNYDEMIQKAGGIDLQILGIGQNGHIAFNEPGEHLNVNTSVVNLTANTIEVNSRFFDSIEEVPTKAISMGIGSILKAKKIILLASGKNKRNIMKELLSLNTITTNLPASMLLLHNDVTIILDKEANGGN